jgi:hypothetical protein
MPEPIPEVIGFLPESTGAGQEDDAPDFSIANLS